MKMNMKYKEKLSIENLLKEDHSFCQASKPPNSEISSWNSETIQFTSTEKKLKQARKPSIRLPKILEESAKLPKLKTESTPDHASVPSSLREIFTKVSKQFLNSFENKKQFEQLGLSEIKPVFYPAKYKSFIRSVKFRSSSLGNEEPDCFHFGCTIPEESTEVSGKDKFNVYPSSYYGKFFKENSEQTDTKKAELCGGKNKNLKILEKNEFRLPQLRSKSSITSFTSLNPMQIFKKNFSINA